MAQSRKRVVQPVASGQSFEQAIRIANACMDAKGTELSVLDVSEQSDLAKYFIIVSGRSDRQAQGIANRIINALQEIGQKPSSIEGFEEGHWILLDCDDVVVHIFYEPTREHYDLEGLWTKAKRLDNRRVLAA